LREEYAQSDRPHFADAERAPAILADVQKEYKIDEKRVSLTGLSMEGRGTWSLAVN
jgi:predicted peptidase